MADSVVEVKCRECNLKLRGGVRCELCLSWFHLKCSKLEDCFREGWKCQHCKETVNQRVLEEMEDLKERHKIAEKKIAELTQKVTSLEARVASDPVKEGLKKIQVGESEKGMVFHSRAGSNVIIGINGRTIEKKNIDEYKNGAAFTSRPLKNDELFEVSLDKKGSKYVFGFFDYCFGIGVLTIKPEDFKFPDYAYDSPHAWMYLQDSIWNNGNEMRSNYGVNINDLPAGTRFGVMGKSSSGDIHFYIDRIDRGSAISGISGPIYGVAELMYNAEKITILNP